MLDGADVFLDTSVLLYAALSKQDAPASFEKARQIILEENFATSSLILTEFFDIATNRGAVPLRKQAAADWIEKLALKPCQTVDSGLVKEGVALSAELEIPLRDALLILSARRLSCSKIYTERLYGLRLPDLEIINPFK
ncbi:MAG: VapC toxin family PIN domain ribonuclease [Ponticaulis sp.]|nr:VapC toxin family PIN domain ribonuclease [Ponticaulis sp.]|tara:strand:+ start:1825 stop:2241 length:417 start_codon:yes stop_codon:yes gene_type:complete